MSTCDALCPHYRYRTRDITFHQLLSHPPTELQNLESVCRVSLAHEASEQLHSFHFPTLAPFPMISRLGYSDPSKMHLIHRCPPETHEDCDGRRPRGYAGYPNFGGGTKGTFTNKRNQTSRISISDILESSKLGSLGSFIMVGLTRPHFRPQEGSQYP